MPKSYEDDIRDILDRMDNFLPEKGTDPAGAAAVALTASGRRPVARGRSFTAQFQGGSLTPHKLMGGSVLLMLFGWLLGMFQPRAGPALHDYCHRRGSSLALSGPSAPAAAHIPSLPPSSIGAARSLRCRAARGKTVCEIGGAASPVPGAGPQASTVAASAVPGLLNRRHC